MEKIKNLLNPGRSTDDETLYGSGQQSGHTGGLTGEGSHLASNTGNTSGLAGSQTGTSGLGSTGTGVTSGTTTGQSGSGIGSNTTGLGQSTGYGNQGSHLASATSGNQTSGLGNTSSTSGNGTTGSHMPGSWDDNYEQGSTNTGFGSNTTSGLGSTTGTTQGISQLGSTTGSSGISQSQNTSHLGRDAATIGTAGAVDEGIHHHRENAGNLGSTTDNTTSTSSGLGSATVYPPTTSHTTHLAGGSSIGTSGLPSTNSNTQSGYSSTLPDKSVGSNQTSSTDYESSQTGNTSGHHLGRDAAAVGATGLAAEGIHHHRENERDNQYTGTSREMPLSSNNQSTTSSSQPLGSLTGTSNNTTSSNTGYGTQTGSNTGYDTQSGSTTSGHHLGRDAAAIGTASAVGEGVHHSHHQGHHNRQHEHGYGSSGVTSGSNAPGYVPGPHSTQTANLLDPNTSGGAPQLENASVHNPRHGGGGEAADQHHLGGSSSTTGTSGHHLGRDAAIGAGGVGAMGLAEHEHRQHQTGTGLGNSSGTSQPFSGNTSSQTDPSYTGTTGQTGTSGLGSTSGVGSSTSRTDPSSTGTSGHHYGRDAAIGAGGVGAAGLAEHDYRKHEQGTGSNTQGSAGQYAQGGVGSTGTGVGSASSTFKPTTSSSTTGASSLPGPAPNTAGPHSKDWMNKVDPRVMANPTIAQGNPEATSILSNTKPSAETGGYGAGSTTGSSSNPSTHLGRDAALGAGGLGAAGLAGHEYQKHHDNTTSTGITGQGQQYGSSDPTSSSNISAAQARQEFGQYGYTAGTDHPSGSATNPATSSSTGKDHHLGRDAAVAGGLGGAAYAAEKHHGKHDTHQTSQLGQSGASATSGNTYPSPDTTTGSKGHHYGRDAAVAGGVGGAAYEADKHHKHDKDLTQAERDAKKQHKHDEKEAKQEAKEHKHEEKEAKKDHKGGLFSFLHRDKNKKYTKEEEDDFARQEKEYNSQNTSHTGRDAALGTAGVGALGAGAYEAEKHHHGHSTQSNVPGSQNIGTGTGNSSQYGTSGSQNVGTGTGNQSTLAGDNTQSSHHYGRDTALGAGAIGTAEYAAHEHNKHQSGTPLADKPVGSDIGDKLHGVDRNRGVQGSSGLSGTQGFGDGSLPHSEASTDQYGRPIGSGLDSTGAGYGSQSSGVTGSQQQGQHHYGRDAALVGGAGGAAALGEHEYKKLEGAQTGSGVGFTSQSQYGQTDSSTLGSSGQYDNSSATTQGQSGHHYGRDAALVGGTAGAGGLAEHEYRKHEGAQQTGSGVPATYSQTGPTGQGQYNQSGSNTLGSTTQGQGQYDNTSSSQGQSGHHYGRDAAAIGGVGGAASLGEHEYRKHEGTQQSGSAGQYDNTSGTQQSSHHGHHHEGRDATATGGAAAVGEHEYRKHEGGGNTNTPANITSSTQHTGPGGYDITDPMNDGRVGPHMTGSVSGQGSGSGSGIGPNVATGSDGHNRLHKDPPANHPASGLSGGSGSGSHVPSSGNETNQIMQEGRQDLGHDTGVANQGNERSQY